MARYLESVCRQCRRENQKLFLKGERCYADKCSFERRQYPPGQHGQGRPRFSEYGVQLREKQKVRRIYGVLERQFRRYFELAEQGRGVTGEALITLLERRLDNVVYRCGFSNSRREARQLTRHSHFLVNGKKVNLPGYLVKPGDVISVRERSRKIGRINEALEALPRREQSSWISVDASKYEALFREYPTRDDITTQIQEQLIVELYSK